MQGGVCYNRAVPMAMASLTGERIIVPPEPGLVGAFGVALETKRRLKIGILKENNFSLRELRDRSFEHKESFTCNGGKKCDRKCEIAMISIEEKIYPFGGACNRWHNNRLSVVLDTERLDLVKMYENLTFRDFHAKQKQPEVGQDAETIGINKSFFVNTFYPLYFNFFARLGFRPLLPEEPEREGMDHKGAAFCYPAEISHGFFLNLLNKEPDYLFLPHVKGLQSDEGCGVSSNCPLSQGEAYYLSSAFKNNHLFALLSKQKRILRPVLDFSRGYQTVAEVFAGEVKTLGIARKKARRAFSEAQEIQEAVVEEMKKKCQDVLTELEKEHERHAIVIIGRSYNAFVSEINMGISQKIASRGVYALPFNFLPFVEDKAPEEMYWSAGQMILKSAKFVERHPQLFACYISNFSCGPDSFLVEYVRHIMGKKPLLVLELDSHTADAGLETRIEAFLDIIKNYRESKNKEANIKKRFIPASFDARQNVFVDSRGKHYDLRSSHINVLFPSMGALGNKAAAVFRSAGIHAIALPPADEETFKLGRANTSCKECLPLLLTVGSLLKYLKYQGEKDKLLVYFMPTASGPCRFGQYSYFLRQMVAKAGIEDVVIFSLQAENSYQELGNRNFSLKLWSGIVLSDIFQNIYSLLLANALDKETALRVYRREWAKIETILEKFPKFDRLKSALKETVSALRRVEGAKPWRKVPSVLLTGEIFVRHDDLSRQFIVEKLADQGFAIKTASLMEWIYYTDYCHKKNLSGRRIRFHERPSLFLRSVLMKNYEKAYRNIAAKSGFFANRREDVQKIVNNARELLNPQLTGEAILTIGGTITEVPRYYCGAIAIGPFGCMPNRLSEAILSKELGRVWLNGPYRRTIEKMTEKIRELPFLSIESDGNHFPQIINAKLEVFLSQATRLHQAIEGG